MGTTLRPTQLRALPLTSKQLCMGLEPVLKESIVHTRMATHPDWRL